LKTNAPSKRLRELDFLRGIAILLVLLRHQSLFFYLSAVGWIGVDLFFVLSGFLVSGLLFKEYYKFGNIAPKRFLIRRGFKIYPIYYLFYIPYLVLILLNYQLSLRGLLGDLFFIQNYAWGWGYAYFASWSLAVEEHFYFGLALALWLIFNVLPNQLKQQFYFHKLTFYTGWILAALLLVHLILRLISNTIFPDAFVRNFTMTHLRMDSLLMGVLLAYFYFFKRSILETFYQKNKSFLCGIALACLSWVPFFDPITSFFVKTFGFSFVYISFGLILLVFLMEPGINNWLNRYLSKYVVNSISTIGFCSYSIYVIHPLAFQIIDIVLMNYSWNINGYFVYLIKVVFSLSIGMLMTYYIESYFLKLRDRFYPARNLQ
jgi:peptidoglycan/LPS O-acetylase OafA/YrhL